MLREIYKEISFTFDGNLDVLENLTNLNTTITIYLNNYYDTLTQLKTFIMTQSIPVQLFNDIVKSIETFRFEIDEFRVVFNMEFLKFTKQSLLLKKYLNDLQIAQETYRQIYPILNEENFTQHQLELKRALDAQKKIDNSLKNVIRLKYNINSILNIFLTVNSSLKSNTIHYIGRLQIAKKSKNFQIDYTNLINLINNALSLNERIFSAPYPLEIQLPEITEQEIRNIPNFRNLNLNTPLLFEDDDDQNNSIPMATIKIENEINEDLDVDQIINALMTPSSSSTSSQIMFTTSAPPHTPITLQTVQNTMEHELKSNLPNIPNNLNMYSNFLIPLMLEAKNELYRCIYTNCNAIDKRNELKIEFEQKISQLNLPSSTTRNAAILDAAVKTFNINENYLEYFRFPINKAFRHSVTFNIYDKNEKEKFINLSNRIFYTNKKDTFEFVIDLDNVEQHDFSKNYLKIIPIKTLLYLDKYEFDYENKKIIRPPIIPK